MKILMVSHEYPPIGGGGANACMHLAKEYAHAGHEVTIVTVWFAGQPEHESKDNIEIFRIKSKRKHAEHCGFAEMLDYLVKAMPLTDKLEREKRFDVCQVFFGIPSGPIGYVLKKKYKLPYVIRFGGGDIPGFQDRFVFVYKAIGPAVKLMWKKADALVANSEGLKKLAEGFYDKKEIKIIPNGADVRAFSSENSNVASSAGENDRTLKTAESSGYSVALDEKNSDNTVHLLFVSRLIQRKGLQDILPQMSKVAKACAAKGVNVVFDIVGDGPFREELEKIVAEGSNESVSIRNDSLEKTHEDIVSNAGGKDLNLQTIIRFHGQKTKAELPKYYSEADLFLFPSRKEGMPNAVLEAMSYGLPIIMTPCQGSDELIDGNGYVLKAEEFGDRIVELCLDKALREKMGQRSTELVEKKFSWGNTARAYLDLFGKIM